MKRQQLIPNMYDINSESIKQFVITLTSRDRISPRRVNLVMGIIKNPDIKSRATLFQKPIIVDKAFNVIDGKCRMKALQQYIHQNPNEHIAIQLAIIDHMTGTNNIVMLTTEEHEGTNDNNRK